MGFLDAIKSVFSGGGSDNAHWVYVRCNRCGETIKTRIDLRNDLSRQDDGGYIVKKVLMGSQRCFERIDVTLTFDDQRRITDRQIQRGAFISAEEYQAAQSEK